MPKLTVEGVGEFEVPAGKRLVLALTDEAVVSTERWCPMVPALDQQGPQVDITRLRDAQLRVVAAGLTASWPQAEIAADVSTSLEPLLATQRQNIGESGQLADAVDLDQRLSLDILSLSELLDQPIIVPDLHRE